MFTPSMAVDYHEELSDYLNDIDEAETRGEIDYPDDYIGTLEDYNDTLGDYIDAHGLDR